MPGCQGHIVEPASLGGQVELKTPSDADLQGMVQGTDKVSSVKLLDNMLPSKLASCCRVWSLELAPRARLALTHSRWLPNFPSMACPLT